MVGAKSAEAFNMFSIVKRSPRRCNAFPPTATTMRSYVGFVELYHRRNTDDDDDDGAILLVRTRRWKEVIILKRRCSGIYVMEVVPEDTEPPKVRCRRSISIGGNAVQHSTPGLQTKRVTNGGGR